MLNSMLNVIWLYVYSGGGEEDGEERGLKMIQEEIKHMDDHKKTAINK